MTSLANKVAGEWILIRLANVLNCTIVNTFTFPVVAGGKTTGNRRGRTQPPETGAAWHSPGHRSAATSHLPDSTQRKQKVGGRGLSLHPLYRVFYLT